ncbi:MAG: AI-2E family transporter [Patescibacteria group bacterium]|nr:AI-2E family transporter [Patescibacteria group bacterium]
MPSARVEYWFFFILLALAALYSWFVFQPYAGALVLGGALAFLFRPLYRKFASISGNATLSAALVVVIVIAVIFLPLALFGVRIVGEATNLYSSLTGSSSGSQSALAKVLSTVFPNLQGSTASATLDNAARQVLSWFIQNLGSLFSGLAQLFFTALVSLIGLFYFLKEGDALRAWVMDHTPLSRQNTEQVLGEIELVIKSVFEGTLVVAVIQGVVLGIGFFIFGIPNPAFWGALAVIVTLVPIVGTWLVAIPGVVYLFVIGQTAPAIGLLIWSIILINLIYNLITPQFVRRRAAIHPFIILLAVLGGISFFGPIGFLAGPLVVALLISLLKIYPEMAAA